MSSMAPSGIASSISTSGWAAAADIVAVACGESVGKASSTSRSMKIGGIRYQATGSASRASTPMTIAVLRPINYPSPGSFP